MHATPCAQSGGRATIIAVAAIVGLHLAWQSWLVVSALYPARYDYDEGVYAATAAAVARGGHLYSNVFLSQPPLLVDVLAHTFAARGRSLVLARETAVAFSGLWLGCLAGIAAGAVAGRGALWAAAIAASAPAFAVASHTVQMEGPSEALAALAVMLGFTAARHVEWPGRVTDTLWASSGLAAGFAVMTKFTGAICLVPLAVALLTSHEKTPAHRAARASVAATGVVAAAAATVIWSGGLSTSMVADTVSFHRAVARAMPVDPWRTASLLGAFAAGNWLITMLGLAGLASAVARRPIGVRWPLWYPVAAWLAADVAALLLWRPVWPHHFAILVTPLAVLGAGALERGRHFAAFDHITESSVRLGTMPRLPRAVMRFVAGVVIAVWLVAVGSVVARNRPETSSAVQGGVAVMRRAIPSSAQVIADDPLIAFLADRPIPPALCDTSEMRMRAGWLTAAMLSAALGDPRVHGLVLWRGTFRRFARGVLGDAANRFPRRWTLGADHEILTR